MINAAAIMAPIRKGMMTIHGLAQYLMVRSSAIPTMPVENGMDVNKPANATTQVPMNNQNHAAANRGIGPLALSNHQRAYAVTGANTISSHGPMKTYHGLTSSDNGG